MIESPFVFAACDPGFERLLKRDVAARDPSLRLAFSGPGYVTFKADAPRGLDRPPETVFARVAGLSFGRAKTPVEALERARALAVQAGGPLAWAVFPRTPRDERLEARAAVEAWLLALREGEPAWARAPALGDVVLDVAVDPLDGAWLGAHRHARELSATPGGQGPIATPPEAPSRAYSKLVEALERFGVEVARGQHALELGSAPGGASLALLERGLKVTGVDPGAMDPRVLAIDRFKHLAVPAGALKKADLPRPIHWVVMDMNLAPRVALRYLERVVGPARRDLLGVVLTLKLNDERMVEEIPEYLKRVRAMGLADVRAAHLPSGGQEICVVGFATSSRGRRGSP
ncbi:MAG: hypothetical protein IPM79_12130 [Polyangiaceae bacterium]|nr:hypothetical protein [Polyangiaceae bacterium]